MSKNIFPFYVSSLKLFCLFIIVVLLYIYNVILIYPLCLKVLYKIKIIPVCILCVSHSLYVYIDFVKYIFILFVDLFFSV